MRAKLGWAVLAAMAVVIAPAARSWAQERTPAAITDIRQEANERSTRLMVECSGPLAYTYYSPDPLTLVVDIPEVDASKIPSRISVGTREVESLRVSSLARADGRNRPRLEVRPGGLVPHPVLPKGKGVAAHLRRPAAAAPPRPGARPGAASAPEGCPRRASRPDGRRREREPSDRARGPARVRSSGEDRAAGVRAVEAHARRAAPAVAQGLGSPEGRRAAKGREGRDHRPPR